MSRAAVRYGKAILALAKEQNNSEVIFAEMNQVIKTISESADLKKLLESPLVKPELKVSSLKAVFSAFSSVSFGLFETLAANKRLSKLAEVALSYVALYKEDLGSRIAVVTTAVPLSSDLESLVLAKVKELTAASEIQIENKIDETIIGGFILRVGDIQYDASIARQLSNIKRDLSDNSYVSQL